MKRFPLITFLLFLFLSGCNKKEKAEPEIPEVHITELTAAGFIQTMQISGAQEINYDSALHAYSVTLPESYTKDYITINLSLYPKAKVFFSSPESSDFYFRAMPNAEFTVNDAKGLSQNFKLYVKHLAPFSVTASPANSLRSDINGNCSVAISKISGIGTIPESPGSDKELKIILKDEASGEVIKGNYYLPAVYFNNINRFLTSEGISVEMHYGDKTVTLYNKLKFSKVRSVVNSIGDPYVSFSPTAINDKLHVNGSGFAKTNRYSAKFENDFNAPVTVDATFENSNSLSLVLPANIVKGSYSLSFYENNELLNRFSKVISSDKNEKAIGQMWKSQSNYPTTTQDFYASEKLTVEKGMPLYANPFPVKMSSSNLAFDKTVKLPALQLKNSSQTIIINPVLKGDNSYADGTTIVYYGRYDIPTSLSSGFYEARMIYEDKSESLPYWNKIEIK